jgi:2,5-dioxopentanoate dehydrogenase
MASALTTKLSGRSLIGFQEGAGTGDAMYATNPTTGARLEPGFVPATAQELDRAANLASKAFETYQRVSGRERGAFLRTIAAKIESIAAEVIERAAQETALPQARLQG